MRFLLFISDYITPFIILSTLLLGLNARIDLYDTFVTGAADGLKTVLKIMPTLIGLMVAVAILRASGLLDFLIEILGSIFSHLHFPKELVPLSVVKMFSSSAATGLLLDIYKTHGPDSPLGVTASIMLSCTETIFYTMSVYFMSAKVTNSRWTLPGALCATIAGLAASVVLSRLLL